MSQFDLRAHLPNSEWCRLQYLVLHTSVVQTLEIDPTPFVELLERLLESFPDSPKLREVAVEWKLESATTIIKHLRNVSDEQYRKLKHALLRFSQPRIVVRCTIARPTCANSLSVWACELEKCLPCSSVTLECDNGTTVDSNASHHLLAVN